MHRSDKRMNRGFLPTLGGKQLWTDWQWADGWRLQRFCWGDIARIVDHRNRLVSCGRFSQQSERFDSAIGQGTIGYPSKSVVVLLHGLSRTRSSMWRLEKEIERRTEYTPVRLSYCSTRKPLAKNAEALRQVLSRFENVSSIDFVCHSMGNLVVRRMLHDCQRRTSNLPFRRMVMLGPPNQGSRMARWLKFSLIFNLLSARGGREFSWNWDTVKSQLATPYFEFGIIAGAQQKLKWFSNPFLPGTDDWTVATSETDLEGAADTMVGPYLHGSIMSNRRVIDATIQFLHTGKFKT